MRLNTATPSTSQTTPPHAILQALSRASKSGQPQSVSRSYALIVCSKSRHTADTVIINHKNFMFTSDFWSNLRSEFRWLMLPWLLKWFWSLIVYLVLSFLKFVNIKRRLVITRCFIQLGLMSFHSRFHWPSPHDGCHSIK